MTSPAPAAVPSEEDVARILFDPENPTGDTFAQQSIQTRARYLRHARNILALFAPILTEKEREIREMADHVVHADAYQAAAMANLDRALAAEAALAAERERCAKIAEGASADFDFAEAQAECRDYDCGYNSGRQLAAAAIRAQGE